MSNTVASMKTKLFSVFGILSLLCLSAYGATPDYKAFRGTGGITVTSNPPNGTIVIDGSGVIGGGGIVSTNANQFGANPVLSIKDAALMTNTVTYSNATVRGIIGKGAPTLQLLATNGTSGTTVTLPPNWIPTNVLSLAFTNGSAGQLLGIADVTSAGGVFTFILTNVPVPAGAAFQTNANQFAATALLTVKDAAVLTNITVYSNLVARGIIGKGSPTLQLVSTNGTSATIFTRPDAWLPTNIFTFSFTNGSAGQLLGIADVTSAGGVSTFILTNVPAPSGAAFQTNANQFGASVLLTIKDGVLLTNASVSGTFNATGNASVNSNLTVGGALTLTNNSLVSLFVGGATILSNAVVIGSGGVGPTASIFDSYAAINVFETNSFQRGTNELNWLVVDSGSILNGPLTLQGGAFVGDAILNGNVYVTNTFPAGFIFANTIQVANFITTDQTSFGGSQIAGYLTIGGGSGSGNLTTVGTNHFFQLVQADLDVSVGRTLKILGVISNSDAVIPTGAASVLHWNGSQQLYTLNLNSNALVMVTNLTPDVVYRLQVYRTNNSALTWSNIPSTSWRSGFVEAPGTNWTDFYVSINSVMGLTNAWSAGAEFGLTNGINTSLATNGQNISIVAGITLSTNGAVVAGGSGITNLALSGITVSISGQDATLTAAGGGSGNVVGPGSAADTAIARFSTTTGKLIQNSGASLDNSGIISAGGVVATNYLISKGYISTTPINISNGVSGLIIWDATVNSDVFLNLTTNVLIVVSNVTCGIVSHLEVLKTNTSTITWSNMPAAVWRSGFVELPGTNISDFYATIDCAGPNRTNAWAWSAGSAGNGQTPWLSDINGAGFNLTNVFKLGIGVTAATGNQSPGLVIGGTNLTGLPVLFKTSNTNQALTVSFSTNGAAYQDLYTLASIGPSASRKEMTMAANVDFAFASGQAFFESAVGDLRLARSGSGANESLRIMASSPVTVADYAYIDFWLRGFAPGPSTQMEAARFYAIDDDVFTNTATWSAALVGKQLRGGTLLESFRVTSAGVMSVTNGYASYVSNQVAITSITVGGSAFNWTNTFTKNIHVYISGQTTGSAAVNGTTILSPMGISPATMSLQPGEWVTLTYTGSPTMLWKPF